MAHRLFARGVLNSRPKIDNMQQKFKYLLILDFEATCDRGGALKPSEIIEFPCLALSTDDWQIKQVFHQYVKPRINPILTPFCIDLTGILQDNVEKEPHFGDVFTKFQQWLNDGGFLKDANTSAFVTCGDWDIKVMLPSQCTLEGVEVPKYFNQWIDLKKSYCEATNYYPRSLRDMLLRLKIPLQGRLHSGFCDTHNMVHIIAELNKRHNTVFQINSFAKTKIKDSSG